NSDERFVNARDDVGADALDLLACRFRAHARYVDTQVQRVGTRLARRSDEALDHLGSVGALRHLVAAPVRGRGARRVAAVHVDLLVDLGARRLAEPAAPHEHAAPGATGRAVRADQLAT